MTKGLTTEEMVYLAPFSRAILRDTFEGWSNEVKQSPQCVLRCHNNRLRAEVFGVVGLYGFGPIGKDKAWNSAAVRKTPGRKPIITYTGVYLMTGIYAIENIENGKMYVG